MKEIDVLENPSTVAALARLEAEADLAQRRRVGNKPVSGKSGRCVKCRKKIHATDEKNSCHCGKV